MVEVTGDHFQTLATDGDVKLGGCDWDQAIVDYIATEYGRENRGLDPRDDPGTLQKLLLQAEDVKRSLSLRSDAKVFLDPPYQFRCGLTREKFEELTEDLVNRTRWTTESVREMSGKTWDQIDTILLVGGSGRMPMITRMLEDLTGKKVTESVSKDEAIAWGAALYAKAILDRQAGKPAIAIGNVNAHSLGVQVTDRETGRPRLSVILEPNQKLPAEGKKSYTVRGASQSIKLKVFEAADPSCTRGNIGDVVFQPKRPLQVGERVEITFRYEQNGRLRIRIERLGTGESWDQELNRNATTTQ